MKTTNYILKVMENLQTNVALLTEVSRGLLKITDTDYNEIQDKLQGRELELPQIAIRNFKFEQEEMYNYLETLMLLIEKPF